MPKPTNLGGLDDLLEEVFRVLLVFCSQGGYFFLLGTVREAEGFTELCPGSHLPPHVWWLECKPGLSGGRLQLPALLLWCFLETCQPARDLCGARHCARHRALSCAHKQGQGHGGRQESVWFNE